MLLVFVAFASISLQAQENRDGKGVWFIFLESGKKTPDDKEAVGKMQRGHIENFKRLFAEKKLFAAGPLRDPAGLKRGIVVVSAASREQLIGYFQPDDYVREGYMTINASLSRVHKGLNTKGIDTENIEEVRIVQITRPATKPDASAEKAGQAFLQGLVDKGIIGAWYTLETGPTAEILFARTTDSKMLEEALALHPALVSKLASLLIWSQWLSKGVVK